MANKKGVPRHNSKNWGDRKKQITHHPTRGTMMIRGANWLVPIPDDFVWDENVVVKDYKENMRVKGGELQENYYRRTRGKCKQCKKEMDISRLTDGYCGKCFRLNEESIEEELAALRKNWRAGAMQLRRGEGLGW